MLCALILYVSGGGTYSLTSASNVIFLEKIFHGSFIYSQSLCQKSAEMKTPEKYFSYLILDDWPGIRSQAFASNKPIHYILDPILNYIFDFRLFFYSSYNLFFCTRDPWGHSMQTYCWTQRGKSNSLAIWTKYAAKVLFPRILKLINYFKMLNSYLRLF